MKFRDFLANSPNLGDRIECGGFEGTVKAIGPTFHDKGAILTVGCEYSGIEFDLKVPSTQVRVVHVGAGKQRILDSPQLLAETRKTIEIQGFTFND